MSHTTVRALFATSLVSLCLSACVEQVDYEPLEDPLVFDGTEIEQITAQNPDAAFRVDMFGPVTYRFDQREADIDFDRVFVHAAGTEVTLMSDLMETHGLDPEWRHWTLTYTADFRAEWITSGCEVAGNFFHNNARYCYCASGDEIE